MAKRIKIGVIYSYDENWIGGTYYYQYLIQSLNLLEDHLKPHIVILSEEKSCFPSIHALEYPYLTCHEMDFKPGFFQKVRNVLYNTFSIPIKTTQKEINLGIDVLFHPSEVKIPNTIPNHLYWIPDFQEYHLPEMFSEYYINFRKKTQQQLLTKDSHILFSSEDAKKDFIEIYPKALSKTYVVNFAVFHPNYHDIEFQELRQKFSIEDRPYFFCPNQFWKHKNQTVIFKALKSILETEDLKPYIIFTGKEYDSRNPDYFSGLKTYIEKHNLDSHVKFLGFIDRKEQLCIMKNAQAVIQPSLFEGWSSVVEDTKAMNQNIIVSNLGVHNEQLVENAYFFNPKDEDDLRDKMIYFLKNETAKPELDYSKNQKFFGTQFIDVIKTMI